MSRKKWSLAAAGSAVVLVACGSDSGADRPEVTPVSAATDDSARLTEAATSELFATANVDSLAFWPGNEQHPALAVATSKAEHDLLVFDALTLELKGRVGGPGSEAGQFQRPNGVAVYGDTVWVVERDNRRVQVLTLPAFEPLALVGTEELVRPYGLTLLPGDDGGVTLFVTDNEMPETPEHAVRPERRLMRYDVDVATWSAAELVVVPAGGRAIAPTEGEGLLLKVETIALDADARLLVVAEESELDLSLKLYDFDGAFDRKINPADTIRHEPEGLVLWQCRAAPQAGYWLLADQAKDATRFRVYSRQTFDVLGTFRGERTANTDGTTIAQPGAHDAMPAGALFAVHDDQGVSAFDLAQVAAALEIPCL